MSIPLTAPIVASVWKLLVSVGDQVQPDQVVAVLESMKMEIPVVAPAAGTITEVPVSPAQIVQEGDPVAWLEPLVRIPDPRTTA